MKPVLLTWRRLGTVKVLNIIFRQKVQLRRQRSSLLRDNRQMLTTNRIQTPEQQKQERTC